MTTYFIISSFAVVIFFYGRHWSLYWSFFCVLVFYAGFRSLEVGGDTYFYRHDFYEVMSYDYNTYSKFADIEFSYFYWNKLVDFLSNGSYRWFLILTAILTYFPIFLSSRIYCSNPHRVVALYVLMYFYFYSYCFTMQLLSITFLYVGFVIYNATNKWWVLLISILYSATWHSGSIFLIMFIPFIHLNNTNYYYLIVVMVISMLLGMSGVFGGIMGTLDVEFMYNSNYRFEAGGRFSINNIVLSIFMLVLIILTKVEHRLINIMGWGVIISCLLSFNASMARVAWNFNIASIIVLSHITTKDIFKRRVLTLGGLLYSITEFLISIFHDLGALGEYELSFDFD